MLDYREWMIKDLRDSGLSDTTILEMRLEEIKGQKGNERLKEILGFLHIENHSILQLSECYLIHYPNNGFCRLKLQNKIGDAKYLSPKKEKSDTAFHLYFLKGEEEKLSKSKYALIITEGEKKAAKVTQELRKMQKKSVCIGLPGITLWKSPDWKDIRLSGREVYICFDSDFRENVDVQQQMLSLFLWLKKQKANVKVITFDKGKGIDDYLVIQELESKSPQEALSNLLDNAEENIFPLVSQINYFKLADAMLSAFYSIDIDCKMIWDEFKLSKQYGITWRTFKSLVTKEYKEKKRELKEKQTQSSGTEESKPCIKIQGGQLPQIVDQGEEALLISGIEIYQRGGFLVRVIKNTLSPKGLKRPEGALVMQHIEVPYLVETLTKAATWLKYYRREDEWSEVDCPKIVGETYLSRGSWKVPILTGIIEAPTLRPDGTILDKAGYDKETGLLLYPGKTNFPLIPQYPNKEDALKAIDIFKNLLCGFPFVTTMDFSVALAAILTALVRRSVRSAPLIGFSAPKMGSGKSLLADIVAMIATGRPCSVMSQSESPEEERKRLLSILMEGDAVICIDNIERPLGSQALCSILTQQTWKDRILGQNKTVNVSTSVSFLATGNNLSFQGDLSTRTLLCLLDPQCERPEERTFDIDLYQYIPEKRGEIVQAALSILRAYQVAGRPKQNIAPYGRFEEWSDFIRSALVWLGLTDPCESKKRIEDADPVRTSLRALLNNWYSVVKEPVSLKDIVLIAKKEENQGLYESLMDIAGDKGEINQKKLGYLFRSLQGRIENGLRLEQAGKAKGGFVLWCIRSIA